MPSASDHGEESFTDLSIRLAGWRKTAGRFRRGSGSAAIDAPVIRVAHELQPQTQAILEQARILCPFHFHQKLLLHFQANLQ